MNNETLKNNSFEQEILSADEQKISNLIGSLEKVSAPNDFDFHLKARIANADQSSFQPSIRQTLRYVLPLTVTAIIAAFVMVQAGLFTIAPNQPEQIVAAQNPVPQIENSKPLNSNTEIAGFTDSNSDSNKTEITQTSSTPVQPKPEQNLVAKNAVKKQGKIKPNINGEDEGFGSKDTTLSQSNVNILPSGIPKNNFPVKQEPKNDFSLSAQEILKFFGLETEYVSGKLKVNSVKEKSIGDNSGIRNGDLIEAVNDQKLDQNNSKLKSNTIKTITVLRDGKTLEISVKTN